MMMRFRLTCRLFLVAAGLLGVVASALAGPPSVGPNVNMVSGTKWPEGDPFLTKQNEPSVAVSSRNARHLLAGSNDYRLVPVEIAESLDDPEAWIQVYKSVDGGASWRATPLGGCPINIPECSDATGLTAPLKAVAPNFGADPTVRPGPYGTFFLSFIAGTRGTGANGVVAVQRFVDKNNDIQRATDARACAPNSPGCVPVYDPPSCTGPGSGCTIVAYVRLKQAEDPILPDVLNIIDTGTPGQSKDKPWVVADVGGRSWNAGKTCELLSWTKARSDVSPAAETVGAFNVYVSYANFTGQGQNQKPQIFVATSTDCGKTFGKPVKVSNPLKANQGSSSAVDPLTGAVYVVWRNFDGPDAIYMVKSTDGGQTWSKKPILVAAFNSYDQGATGVSFRTLDFPSVAVSVDSSGVSRVHVAWSQRKAAPALTPPYGCPAANPADCDARIVVATSTDGGQTWPAAVPVDPNVASAANPANPDGRGHQVQASLTFAAGKLLATWVDQRLDHTEGVLQCPSGQTCTSVNQLVEVRRAAKNSNLDPSCHVDVSQPPLSTLPPAQKALLDHCFNPAAVWTPFITDGTAGLVRRHTVDVFTAMADPANVPVFASSRVSQYTFGSTVQGTINADGTLTPQQGTYEIVQKEVNPPNLPMFSNGKSAFIGDYIDAAGQIIVATGDPAHPYKFNVGGGASGPFATGGFAPAFQVAFTDNRDVIPPLSGDWTTPTCTTSAFTTDASGNITGVNTAAGCGSPGYAGNRNQNVYTAAVTASSLAIPGSNSKKLDPVTPRGFVFTLRNLSSTDHTYNLTLPAQAAGVAASFDKSTFPSGPHKTTLSVVVQPRSSSARTVWATSATPGSPVVVQIAGDDGYSTRLVLNPDPNAPLVTNGDGGGPTTDTAADNVGNVVLSNAVLTNNALSNNALTNNVLSNNALTNAALSNVVLSNAVLSNLDPATAALSNNALTNAVLSNVVLSNAVLSNNALSNAVLSNVVLSNNAQNAALTNLDPTNVALSNAVLSNNALTNVVLSNLDPNAALSNAMLTNNALSNAVLSNVALSNAALSNNALTNDSLRYVALSNAPLGDAAHGGDPDALRAIEPASIEIVANPFQTAELANSNFKETTFTLRNRGNGDTTVSVKLMLRDAICDPVSHACTPPPNYDLQLVLRKVALVPVAIPPTGPAVNTGRAIRIGLGQVNTEVSNVTALPLIDPNAPNFGQFDADNAAMLSLASGEWAYATIRAIGKGGAMPPDPADLLQWGVKTVATSATDPGGPLVIRTLNFPAAPAFVALNAATPAFQAFGGKAPISGAAVCSDSNGNTVLNGTGAPTSNLGALGNRYIDTSAQMIYGPKTSSGWGAGTSLIVNGPSGPQASVPCPPGPIVIGAFATDASFNSTSTVAFTPKYWGDFYILASVSDQSSPVQTDRQVIKVTVQPRPPVLTYTGFPTTLTYNTGINLAPLVSSDSKNGAGVAQPIVFSASGSCHVAGDGVSLVIDRASPYSPAVSDCVVTVHQDGNEIYAPVTQQQAIFIDRASQTIAYSAIPADHALQYSQGTTVVAAVSSTTAPPSGLAVTFTSLTSSVCTINAATGVVTTVGAGTCTIQADQGGNANYKAAPPNAQGFVIDKAIQNLVFGAAPAGVTFGDAPVLVSASSSSPTAAPSGIPIVFSSQTPLVCTTGGSASVTITGAGTCTIAANQAGNANYNPATQVTQSFGVAQSPTQFGVAAQQFAAFGSVPTITAALNRPGNPSVFPIDTATVTVKLGGTVVKTYTPTPVGPSGTITITDATIVPETYTVTFDYAGNANFLAATQATSTLRVEGFSGITATMSTPRAGHTATLLLDGNVLVVGGGIDGAGTPTSTAEVYCTAVSAICAAGDIGTFKAVGAMSTPRAGHTATLLPDGTVLVAGGTVDTAGNPTALVERYCTSVTPACPVANGSAVAVGSMTTARTGHTATLLSDNTVLIAGGFVDATNPPTNAAEVYCTGVSAVCVLVDVGTFKATPGTMATPRDSHTATRLGDGTILLAGGDVDGAGTPTANAEIYCPTLIAGACTAVDIGKFKSVVPGLGTARWSHTATSLADGRVLISGGSATPTSTASAEEYCAVVTGNCAAIDVGKFKAVGSLGVARVFHESALLTDARVLTLGGLDATNAVLSSSELFDPAANTFAPGMSMASVRSAPTATRLPDGRVLVTGGRTVLGGAVSNTAELYNGPF